MKKFIISILFLAFSLFGTSQHLLENKLLEVFSVEQTNAILKNDQQRKYYNNIIFNSYKIEKIESSKLKKQNFVVLNSLEIKNSNGSLTSVNPKEVIESIENGTFNILKYRFERDLKVNKVYLLGNTSHILKISSFNALSKLQKQ